MTKAQSKGLPFLCLKAFGPAFYTSFRNVSIQLPLLLKAILKDESLTIDCIPAASETTPVLRTGLDKTR